MCETWFKLRAERVVKWFPLNSPVSKQKSPKNSPIIIFNFINLFKIIIWSLRIPSYSSLILGTFKYFSVTKIVRRFQFALSQKRICSDNACHIYSRPAYIAHESLRLPSYLSFYAIKNYDAECMKILKYFGRRTTISFPFLNREGSTTSDLFRR